MKLQRILLGLTLSLAISTSANAQTASGIDHPVTKAVLEVYSKQLRETPDDYMTWFKRANEYYRHSEYMRALNDIDEALKYAPASDKDLRFQAYMLRAGIYNQTLRHTEALSDLNSAIAIEPKSYSAIYQRANTEFELEQYTAAKADYNKLRTINNRGTESYIGLARVAVKENNLGQANEYLDQAVALDPNNAEIYNRRSSVRKMMGNDAGAVEDLILSISTGSDNSKALAALVDYANTNYDVTIAGITNAITTAPNVPIYRYLRAVIEQAHYRYIAAIEDYNLILTENNYEYHGIYASIAECKYALDYYDEALTAIQKALSMTTNVASYYITQAKVLIAMGRPDDAIEASAKALAITPNDAMALVQMGVCYAAAGNAKEASNLFGEAIMTDSSLPIAYMWRSKVMRDELHQEVAAAQTLENLCAIDGYDLDDVRSLKGFALLALGRTDEANQWMSNILRSVTDSDGLINYYGACFYAAAGNSDKALECADKALSLGYGNHHDWTAANEGGISIGNLRDDLRFLNLLDRYGAIFGRK